MTKQATGIKYRGVRLSGGKSDDFGRRYYKYRQGREVVWCVAPMLPDDWKEQYARWHLERGEIDRAAQLRQTECEEESSHG